MKTAFVTHYSEMYGANISLLTLIEGLREYGVKPYVVAPSKGDMTRELSSRSVPFCTAPFRTWMSRTSWKAPGRLLLNLAVLPYLTRKISKWGADHIHSNSSVTPIGALLAEILSLNHTWHIREFGDRDFNLKHDWGEAVFRMFINRADAAIAVSESLENHVLSDVNIPTHVVYNGVISRARLEEIGRSSSYKNCNQFTFSIVGRISQSKGQKQAIRALEIIREELDNVKILIAGTGSREYVKCVKKLAGDLNLQDHVTFLGYVEDPYKVYRQSDAVLMCSPHEAMGRVTAEAMAAARPVIGYNSDGTAELIDNENNGLLYDGTTEHLACCMGQLVENPDWSRSLGRNGWEKARREYTNEVYAQQVFDVLSNTPCR
jgi:glycosyltransferase involved in cell wall biosynthesis